MTTHLDASGLEGRPSTASSLGVVLTGLVVWGVLGCGESDRRHPSPEESFERLERRSPETVAAEVGGKPVGLEAFQSHWNQHPELSRDEVVEAVIDRRVIVHRARQRNREEMFEGLGYVRKRGLVQRLLQQTVEQDVTRDDLEEKALEDKMDELRKKLGRPAGLKASHLLVMVPKSLRTRDADSTERVQAEKRAKRWSRKMYEYVSEEPTVEELYQTLHHFESKVPDSLRVVVNARLTFKEPDADREARSLPDTWKRVVDNFADGADELADEGRFGQISEPIQSHYGWHLIVVHDTLPAHTPDPDDLRELAVDRLLQERRSTRLKERFQQWKKGMDFLTYPSVFEDELRAGGESESN